MNKEQLTEEEVIEVMEMPEAILRVADAGEKLLASGLTQRAIVLLIQDHIGSIHITKKQVTDVLRAIPQLKKYISGRK